MIICRIILKLSVLILIVKSIGVCAPDPESHTNLSANLNLTATSNNEESHEDQHNELRGSQPVSEFSELNANPPKELNGQVSEDVSPDLTTSTTISEDDTPTSSSESEANPTEDSTEDNIIKVDLNQLNLSDGVTSSKDLLKIQTLLEDVKKLLEEQRIQTGQVTTEPTKKEESESTVVDVPSEDTTEDNIITTTTTLEDGTVLTLVELDVNSMKSTTKYTYTKDESKKTETYEAKDEYKFNKVKHGNDVVWTPYSDHYGTKVILSIDDQGKTKVNIDFGEQSSELTSSQVTTLDLDVSKKRSTDQYTYTVFNNIGTFTTRKGYGFDKVYQKGTSGFERDLWETDDPNVYATSVSFNQVSNIVVSLTLAETLDSKEETQEQLKASSVKDQGTETTSFDEIFKQDIRPKIIEEIKRQLEAEFKKQEEEERKKRLADAKKRIEESLKKVSETKKRMEAANQSASRGTSEPASGISSPASGVDGSSGATGTDGGSSVTTQDEEEDESSTPKLTSLLKSEFNFQDVRVSVETGLGGKVSVKINRGQDGTSGSSADKSGEVNVVAQDDSGKKVDAVFKVTVDTEKAKNQEIAQIVANDLVTWLEGKNFKVELVKKQPKLVGQISVPSTKPLRDIQKETPVTIVLYLKNIPTDDDSGTKISQALKEVIVNGGDNFDQLSHVLIRQLALKFTASLSELDLKNMDDENLNDYIVELLRQEFEFLAVKVGNTSVGPGKTPVQMLNESLSGEFENSKIVDPWAPKEPEQSDSETEVQQPTPVPGFKHVTD